MRKKNTADIRGEASVLLSVLPTLLHISAQKIAPVSGKKLELTKCL